MTNERGEAQAGLDGRFSRQVLPEGSATDEFAPDTLKPNIDNDAAPRVLHWLPGVFLLAAVVVGGLLTVTSKGARTLSNGQDVVTGAWAHTYETGLDAGVPFRDPSVSLLGTVSYRLFHEAREGALVGSDGWLYTSEEFQTSAPKVDQADVAQKLTYIREVRDQLKAQGTDLIVALVPAKVRVYPEHLGSLQVPVVKANLYQDFRAHVLALGVPAPDLYAALVKAKSQGEVFIRTDTHWSPFGAQVVAGVISAAVKQDFPRLDLPAASFQTTLAAAPVPLGDLLRYLPLPKGQGPQAVMVRIPTTTKSGAGGGLLGEDPVAVTLVGTSYSAVKDWNFEGALKQALGADVLNVADAGQGPVVPMRAYLKSQAIKDAPPKLVIWEIPERFLRFKY